MVSFLAARGFPCLQHWHGPLGCGGDFLATTLYLFGIALPCRLQRKIVHVSMTLSNQWNML